MSSPPPVSSPAPVIPPPINTTSPPPSAVTPPPTAAASPQSTPLPPATSPPPPPLPPVASPSISPPPPAAIPPSISPPPPATIPPSTSPPLPVTNPPTISPPAIVIPPPSISPPATSPPQPPIPPPNSGSGKLPPATKSPPRSSPPPPPPPPPTSRVSLSPPAAQSSGGSSVTRGQVVGVAIGGVLVISVLCILFIFCCRKKKKKGQHEAADYYIPHSSTPPKDGQFGGQPWQWQHNAPPPKDQVIQIVPKLPPPPGTSSRPQQSPLHSPSEQPPPPLLFTGSSGGSASNYSGSSNPLPSPSAGMALSFSKSTFSYEELAIATNGFSDANLLGQGGFGYVHKGVLPNGKEVAVKQLKAGSGQGEREFQAEVEIISRVHHKHLVSLVGYCMVRAERLLVYEFVPNNTLEFHLHGKGRPTMEWPKRLRIALGAAKGLAYLHEDCHPKIIHRDIKAANILLDFNFETKVADFGLAKITSDMNTHVSTRVMGTFGYLAPEYASSGKLTDKSDVFSFGVMLLELVTGRRPIDTAQTFVDDSLVEWARPLLTRAMEEGNFEGLVDPRLLKDYNQGEMLRMVASAAACVRHSARHRPRMSQVVRALEGDMSLSDLNEGNKPGHSTMNSSHESSDYDTMQYNEDMKKFRKMAFSSQEYASSEVSRPTSEYGLNLSGSSSEGQRTREMDTGKMRKDRRGFSGNSDY